MHLARNRFQPLIHRPVERLAALGHLFRGAAQTVLQQLPVSTRVLTQTRQGLLDHFTAQARVGALQRATEFVQAQLHFAALIGELRLHQGLQAVHGITGQAKLAVDPAAQALALRLAGFSQAIGLTPQTGMQITEHLAVLRLQRIVHCAYQLPGQIGFQTAHPQDQHQHRHQQNQQGGDQCVLNLLLGHCTVHLKKEAEYISGMRLHSLAQELQGRLMQEPASPHPADQHYAQGPRECTDQHRSRRRRVGHVEHPHGEQPADQAGANTRQRPGRRAHGGKLDQQALFELP